MVVKKCAGGVGISLTDFKMEVDTEQTAPEGADVKETAPRQMKQRRDLRSRSCILYSDHYRNA